MTQSINDKVIIGVVNSILCSNYASLSQIPIDSLRRVYMVLEITRLISKEDVTVFICKKEDVREDDPNT